MADSDHLTSSDDLESLARLGERFRAQQVGRRPGPLAHLVAKCARQAGQPFSFARLLDELELEAARRELYGEATSPVEKVDRIWGLVTLHLPKRGRVQVAFGTLRNHLTRAKKTFSSELTVSAKP